MNIETPVKGLNSTSEINNIFNGIENGVCTVKCVASTTSVDGAGDYRITRRLECIWTTPVANAGENIIDVEISGTKGVTPVVTLNGQVVPASSIIITPNGVVEIRDFKGMLLDKVQLPVNQTTNYLGTSPTGGIGMNPKPFMGIAVRPVSPDLAHNLAIDARNVCVISEVLPGCAAFYAGLEPNDLILGINGKQANLATLRHELDAAKIGQILNLVILCKGIKKEVQVALDGNTVNTTTFPTVGNGFLGKAMQGGMPAPFFGAQVPGAGYPTMGNNTGLGWATPAQNWAGPYSGPATTPFPFDGAFSPVCPVTGLSLKQVNAGYAPKYCSTMSNWAQNLNPVGSMV
jgi:hypothetical protein